MDVAFFFSPRKASERHLAMTFQQGAHRARDRVVFPEGRDRPEQVDAVCVIGIKDANLMNHYRQKGIPVIYWDKSYDRHKGWWRMAINGNHPTRYLTTLDCPDDRREFFKWEPQPWNRRGTDVMIAGSSGKFHHMNQMMDPHTAASNAVHHLRMHTKRHIIYRPKPNHNDALPIDGTEFNRDREIQPLFKRTWVMVTYGSNACFEGFMKGIPSIVLGTAVLKPISSTRLIDVENPKLASDDEKRRLLNDLAYHQWKPEELVSGAAWEWMREKLTL